ncbi:MAG: poly-gamma-glutamate system protein [Candidatus Aminicenantes bacterium]|nr:poly-gamma-glutamate system protein [Candidatus Aminicenantes bacterium]
MVFLKQKGEGNRKRKYGRSLSFLAILSLVFFILSRLIPNWATRSLREDMLQASKLMSRSIKTLKDYRRAKGISIDPTIDINRTGLIGLETSPLTTSLGGLKAKRTSVNPDFAGLVVYLFKKAGVGTGDTIAVGASGSFPALILSVLSAAEVLKLDTLLYYSLGASQWGANHPEFHWLTMEDCLSRAGIFDTAPLAVSLGGEEDTGKNIGPELRAALLELVEKKGFRLLEEPDFEKNVASRMRIYLQAAGDKKIKAFINVGGNTPNIGVDSEILNLKPGLVQVTKIPPRPRRGMVFEMAARDIPVIHLLFIKGLAERYGLPWDPVPLPRPGESPLFSSVIEKHPSFFSLAVLYVILFTVVFLFRKKIG